MSYTLNKTDGTVLTELIDGTLDSSTTDLTLIGRNSIGFGEAVNENFIKLLENFANADAPELPINGQLWYDTVESRLKVFDNNIWKSAGGPSIRTDAPLGVVEGDLWYDEANKQLKIYDGEGFRIVGPTYSANYGQTEHIGDYIRDVQGRNLGVIKLYIGSTFVGVYAGEEFLIDDSRYLNIDGFDLNLNGRKIVRKGFNPLSDDFKWHGSALNADSLNGINAENFVRTDITSTIDASLKIRGGDGLTFAASYKMFPEANSDFVLRNLVNNRDLKIQVNSIGTLTDAVVVKSTDKRVGIFNSSPQAQLHVGTLANPGSVIIEGNLTVKGTNTSISTTEVQVEDINITLGDTANPTDILANGGGITLKGSSDHYLKWFNTTTSKWEFDDNVNLKAGKTYYIDDQEVINPTTLGSTILNSSLQTLGVLSALEVNGTADLNDLRFSNNVIDSLQTDQNIVIRPNGNGAIDASGAKIVGLGAPTLANDAASKSYVDGLIANVPQTNTLAVVATTGEFADLLNKPTTVAGYGITDAFDGNFGSLNNRPSTLAGYGITDAATSAQGTRADTAVQPADNITTLTNDANFVAQNDNVSLLFNDAQYVSQNGTLTGDLKGSVYATDNTLIVDGTAKTIDWSFITSTPTTTAGYGITDAFDGDYPSLTNKPFIPLLLEQLSDVNITGVPTTNYVLKWNGASWTPAPDVAVSGPFEGQLTGELIGSVFGDDSTLLVDGINKTINLANNNTDDLGEGTTNLYYTDARADARISNALGGNVVIGGDLTVNGTTTTINTATLDVEDLNITVAKNATDNATADGAGITVAGSNASIVYDGTNDEWDFNKSITVPGLIATGTVDLTGATVTGASSETVPGSLITAAANSFSVTIDTPGNYTMITHSFTSFSYSNNSGGNVNATWSVSSINATELFELGPNGGVTQNVTYRDPMIWVIATPSSTTSVSFAITPATTNNTSYSVTSTNFVATPYQLTTVSP